jgi:signal peptidase I
MNKTENNPKEKLKEGALFTWEAIKTIGAVALFVVFFRYFVIQPFYIIGNSMNPDFQQGEYLFIDEASYYLRAPARGEVVVFKHPESGCNEFVENNRLWSKIAQGPCTSYIKRVIGLPGETVTLKAGKFTIKDNKTHSVKTLPESYIESGVTTLGDQSVTLAKDEYYVVGDNRQPNQSYDSRQWGPLKRNYITGRAWLRLLPVDKLGFIGKAKY